jgi:NADPH:quinone reductase-like Zn-dependent oxidoreductase
MKAFVTSDTPGRGLLKDVPKPIPGPGQVLVKVIAAAQNVADCTCLTQNGCLSTYQLDNPTITGMVLQKCTAPDLVVGQDFAGVIEEIGPDVDIPIGRRVAGFISGGLQQLLLQ